MESHTICPLKTHSDLEWDRLLAALAERAQSALGKQAARALPFAPSRAAALRALEEVREAVELDIGGEPLTIGNLPDAEPAIERARIGAPLDAEELRAVLGVLGAARSLRAFLRGRRERAPHLFEACEPNPWAAAFGVGTLAREVRENSAGDGSSASRAGAHGSTDASDAGAGDDDYGEQEVPDPARSKARLDELERDLERTFDADGGVSDRASPELAAARNERRSVRDRLVRKLEELISRHSDLLQDGFYTERDGRYVLPVRADVHERLPGIVHAESASGATVFVEPRAVVEHGNRLKMLDAQIDRAIRAILDALSAKVAAAAADVADALRSIAHADIRAAAARLTRDLRLTFPEIAPEGEAFAITLRNARHPLLVLDGVDVVPSDVEARQGEAIVVSGPNAGGKTIALKTLGLAALMVRAGLPIPARDGSRLGIVEAVLTDVGDDQNLHKNLSTFSAHIRNLARILGETRPGALVLLDEVCGGTDPREGEALAAALLDSLVLRGGAVACTTHYEGLKTLALTDDRFKNASVGFDLATMSPTFRLAIGVPGPSSALAVARRFGIPDLLIERAEKFLTRETIAFEDMVQKLVAERAELDALRAAAARDADLAASKRREAEHELERLRSKEKGAVTDEGQELLSALRRAREELRVAQTKLRTNPTEADMRAATQAIDAVARKASLGGELSPRNEVDAARAPVAASAIKVGSRVFVPKLGAEAEVREVLASGQLKVSAGSLTLTTRVEDVRAAGPATPSKSPSKQGKSGGSSGSRAGAPNRAGGARSIQFDAAADPDVPIQTSDNSVDLRGLRAHEAAAMAEQFLDRMLSTGKRVAFLIHGHGTGALRETIRDSMRGNPYVARSRAGEQREGGDGVTVVWLR